MSLTYATAPKMCSLAGCHLPVVQTPGKGRPRKYCVEAHERAAYVARRKAARALARAFKQTREADGAFLRESVTA